MGFEPWNLGNKYKVTNIWTMECYTCMWLYVALDQLFVSPFVQNMYSAWIYVILIYFMMFFCIIFRPKYAINLNLLCPRQRKREQVENIFFLFWLIISRSKSQILAYVKLIIYLQNYNNFSMTAWYFRPK